MARLSLAAFALSVLSTWPASADPIVVDAVVARVDGRPLLLSALRPRLRQLEAQLRRSASPSDVGSRIEKLSWRSRPQALLEPPKRSTAIRAPTSKQREARRALLDHAIDEALLAARARQLSIRVTPADVDAALASIAKQNALEVPELLARAAEAGYSDGAYRAELERQLLEQRVVLAELAREGRRWPEDPNAFATLMDAQRRALLGRLRKHACIERRVRW